MQGRRKLSTSPSRHLSSYAATTQIRSVIGATTSYAAFTALNIEAYPDPAPPIIEIIAQYPGQSPEEMERYVTIPLEIA